MLLDELIPNTSSTKMSRRVGSSIRDLRRPRVPEEVEVSKKDQTAIERITVGPSREREVLAVAYDRLQEVFAKRYPFVGKDRI
jgi:hypothetical protein